MKVLVLGCKGQLGLCLRDQLEHTTHEVVFTSRDHIDVADFYATKHSICEISPDVVINATAYTAVDKAEEDKEMANLINHLAVENIAMCCNELDCWLIHVSTDYVFDGKATSPYREKDETNPQSVYGDTKLRGELAIHGSGCKRIIIRTAWIFSEYGNNFLKTMLRLGAERDELSIVRDQIGCPTYAQDIARAIVAILPSLCTTSFPSGTFHYCGDQPCSWYDFARAIFEEAELIGIETPKLVYPIDARAYPTAATRPGYSVLDCSRFEDQFKILPSDWRLGIQSCFRKL
jgi:dTDP-4-dehydrorhamnose reductase